MRHFLLVLLAVTLAGPIGCQRANRYPAVATKKAVDPKASPIWGWIAPDKQPRDLPMRFVTSEHPAWASLPAFGDTFPTKVAGIRTAHVGQSPLAIAAIAHLLDDAEVFLVKVPLGLPDPTPMIPAANPPTFGKWRLGRRIFYEKLLTSEHNISCAYCHDPDHGFTEANRFGREGNRNTLSLLNVVYNRSQFWDGRVRDLEEVLVHSVSDELDHGGSRSQSLSTHRFGGVARFLEADPVYREEFRQAFGIPRVTQDAVAKALATYVRTILSGDSIYDRARALAPNPTAEHFKTALAGDALKRIALALNAKDTLVLDELSHRIAQGRDVFFSSAGCSMCHSGPTFTNGTYANVLIGDSELPQRESGKETGRFIALPIGVKDFAMRGAYRVPTLRNLSATRPYFHDGSRGSLYDAIGYFGKHLDPKNPLLAPQLRDLIERTPSAVPGAQPFLFTPDEHDSLLAFLLALDGQPPPPMVLNRP